MFNYYQDLEVHGSTSSSEFCLKDTAAHEFGHAAGLGHVTYNTKATSGQGNCPSWYEYTMHTRRGRNYHGRESLECEDIWALDYKY